MASSKEDAKINLDLYVDQTQAQVYGSYPVANVFLKDGESLSSQLIILAIQFFIKSFKSLTKSKFIKDLPKRLMS